MALTFAVEGEQLAHSGLSYVEFLYDAVRLSRDCRETLTIFGKEHTNG